MNAKAGPTDAKSEKGDKKVVFRNKEGGIGDFEKRVKNGLWAGGNREKSEDIAEQGKAKGEGADIEHGRYRIGHRPGDEIKGKSPLPNFFGDCLN